MGNVNSEPVAAGRRIEEWTEYSKDFLSNYELQAGDLIEIDRETYSHWVLYCGPFDLVVHFNPEDDEAKIPVFEFGTGIFVPGKVITSRLQDVAGNLKLRVNNKPENQTPLRPTEELPQLISDLANKPGFTYSFDKFNSEHFVTFLKFQRHSYTAPIEEWNDRLAVILSTYTPHLAKNMEHTLAHLQWLENLEKSRNPEAGTPRKKMEYGLSELNHCVQILEEQMSLPWICRSGQKYNSIEEIMLKYEGDHEKILFSKEFYEHVNLN